MRRGMSENGEEWCLRLQWKELLTDSGAKSRQALSYIRYDTDSGVHTAWASSLQGRGSQHGFQIGLNSE